VVCWVEKVLNGLWGAVYGMVLLVDDILKMPFKIGGIILNVLSQTVEKTAWTRYQGELNKMLLQARRDVERGKMTGEQFKQVEQHVFQEMRVARQHLNAIEKQK
jgi:hypothetical protein